MLVLRDVAAYWVIKSSLLARKNKVILAMVSR